MLKRIFYKIDKIILIATFGLMIYIPLFTGIIQEDKTASNTEKRNLAKIPPLPNSLDELVKFPKQFNQYYSDHFGFREKLTRAYFKNINKLGRQSSIDDVTFGQENWLFLGSTKPGYVGYGDPIGGAMNVNLFTQKELENYAEPIIATNDWLKKQGIAYIFVIAPNKHSIYFDKLPDYVTKKNKISAIDQLVTYLHEHTDVVVVDLRQALIEGRKKHQVYYRSDTHWNHYGANIAQHEIIQKVKEIFPEKISPMLLTDHQFEMNTKDDGDLAKLASIEAFSEPSPQPIFEETCNTYIELYSAKEASNYTTTCNTQKLKTIIYRDSFFTALQPYFSKKFLSATYIQERISQASLVEQLEENKPDIVINEVVERGIP